MPHGELGKGNSNVWKEDVFHALRVSAYALEYVPAVAYAQSGYDVRQYYVSLPGRVGQVHALYSVFQNFKQ